MSTLEELESQSIFILREMWHDFKKPAVLWSMGKDSTTMLWLCKKAFMGDIPFPVIHIDTGYKFKEMYEFRDKYSKEWNFKLVVASNKVKGVGPENKMDCCTKLKTEALKKCLDRYKFDALILAIRRDEHGIRAKERYYSLRDREFKWNFKDQPLEIWNSFPHLLGKKEHMRVHPVLHWRELDIWEYTQKEGIPVNPMYFSKDGKRYRSLGCQPCTNPIDSTASTIDQIVEEIRQTKAAERAGRAQDKEHSFTMQKLRTLGYM